jgi:hypothetical protein
MSIAVIQFYREERLLPIPNPVGTVMTKEYVATVGRLAYIWGWKAGLNPNVLESVKAAGLAEQMGKELMFYNADAAINRYHIHYRSCPIQESRCSQ